MTNARRRRAAAAAGLALAGLLAACSPTPGPTTTTTTSPPASLQVTVLTGTSGRTVLPADGAAQVDEVQSVTGSTSGLVVHAAPTIGEAPGVEVRVDATTSPAGSRTLQVQALGCTVAHDDAEPCPTGSTWTGVLPLVVIVAEPTTEVPSTWSSPAASAWRTQPDGTTTLPHHVDVYLSAPNDVPPELAATLSDLGGTAVGAESDAGIVRVRVPDVDVAVAALTALAGVDDARPTAAAPVHTLDITPADATALHALPSQPDHTYVQVQLPELWKQLGPVAAPSIGLVDVGIYSSHPDLRANFKKYGYAAPRPIDAVQGDTHGTHVAGTLCAADGNAGPVGVVPGCRLEALNLAGWTSSFADQVAAIATALKGWKSKVVNMSIGWGADQSDSPACSARYPAADRNVLSNLFRANQDKLFVVAANNCGRTRNGPRARESVLDEIPAANSRDNANVVSVSATSESFGGATRKLSDFSTPDGDVAAPGTGVTSSTHVAGSCAEVPRGTSCSVPTASPAGVARAAELDGTSMASPLVAGLAGLVSARRPNLTGAQLKRCLLDAATTEVDGITNDTTGIDPDVKEVNALDLLPCMTAPDLRRQPDGHAADGSPEPPNGPTNAVSMAADGSVAALETAATNLVPGGAPGIVLWDLSTNSYVAPPPGVDGNPPAGGTRPQVSDDGKFVAFESCSPNLPGAGGPDGDCSPYVWDVDRGIYLTPPPLPWAGWGSGTMKFSANGKVVAISRYNYNVKDQQNILWVLPTPISNAYLVTAPSAVGIRTVVAVSDDGRSVLYGAYSDSCAPDYPTAATGLLWNWATAATTLLDTQTYAQTYCPYGTYAPGPDTASILADGTVLMTMNSGWLYVPGRCSADPYVECGIGEGPGQTDYSPVRGHVGTMMEAYEWSPSSGAFGFSPAGADGLGLRNSNDGARGPEGGTFIQSVSSDGRYVLLLTHANNAVPKGRYSTSSDNWIIWDRQTSSYVALPNDVADATNFGFPSTSAALSDGAQRMVFVTSDQLTLDDTDAGNTAYVLFR